MINNIEEFIKYFHGQRRRTKWMIDALPTDKADWSPWPDEPTPAEILCRTAATHLMYATVIVHDYWVVDDFERGTTSWRLAQHYYNSTTEDALDLIRPLPNSILKAKRKKPNANLPTTVWRFFMAMLDSEIQARTQLGDYLMLLDVKRPQLEAVSIDAVRAALDAK